jgi:hypothetical protein
MSRRSDQGLAMFTTVNPTRRWSDIGLRTLIGSIAACIALAIADAVMRGPVALSYAPETSQIRITIVLLSTLITDFRYLAEQGVYAATIFFVGAKFFETRTIFDKLDADKLLLKGPDGDNVVWIGHRYGTAVEAETVAAAFAERLKQDAA